VLIALLSDIVKPQLSAYKHAKLTDQGTVRIRPRDDRHNFVEINPPVETVSILRWVSTQLDVSPLRLSLTKENHHTVKHSSATSAYSHTSRFLSRKCQNAGHDYPV